MPSRSEITYFGAGPALLPTDVLEKAAQALIDYENTGLGIAEHSHRSELATNIINEAKADLASYIDIPEDYEVLFMQGGGSGEFSATMYNLVGAWVTKKKAQIVASLKAPEDDPRVEQELRNAVEKELKTDYIVTGGWSQKASEEAKRLLGPEHVNIAADARQINDGKYGKIPEESTWNLSKNAALVYYCDNETVDGVEFPVFPQCLAPGPDGEGPIVVADMSSNILSRRIPVRNFSVIFFGAQKNLGCTGVTVVIIKKSLLPPKTPQPAPALLRRLGLPIPPVIFSYETIAKNNSLYNTLSIFDVYIAGQVLKKSLDTYNKVEGQEAVSAKKAQLIYDALEAHPAVYRIVPDKSIRSRMNICFRVTKNGDTDGTEKAFLKESTAQGLTGLKGHRSVGGIRASNYNSIPLDGAEKLAKLPNVDDTIYALSTAQGRAGIAVIRISGPSCLEICRALCPSRPLPKPRYATLRSLYDPQSAKNQQVVLDSEALILYFPNPNTVTGDDVLELHVHGGSATVKAVLSAIPRCSATHRIRYAEPGEFTKRAFFNDRLDLAQIESLSDTLAAETEQQRRAAVRGNSGSLGRQYESWREQLLLARGEIEALIDFSEDQHFDESQAELLQNVTAQVARMLHSIELHEQGSQRSELLRNGIRIALLGPPNVGKSSLMNLIVGREASIVSGEAGTTRDIIEASLDIRGYLCSFADTAGFRSNGSQVIAGAEGGAIGAVEEEGIRRAKQRALDSDLVIVLASVEEGLEGPFLQYDEETLDLAAGAEDCLIVINKQDALDKGEFEKLVHDFRQAVLLRAPKLALAELVSISCKEAQTGTCDSKDPGGIQAVITKLVASFEKMTSMPVDLQDLLGVTERQRQLLIKCRQHLEDFMAEATPEEGMDADTVLAAEYLRYAADCLSRITGRGEFGDVEDVLGVIFEK
ncbi:tRNA modification GTPase TrmE [Fusarium austroafricanum]|uniref:phosphoserine transaminase n=1 Tax=Fusarium austroafricanum TaxID=2364996 RepID=A0A8H4P1M6_9HYPO|nr:tRNA modification GTPase TrmE [Fusarium austroafricanum]